MTRSRRTRTRRQLAREVDDLRDGGEYPPLTLAEIFVSFGEDAPDPVPVDQERRLYRVNGEVKQLPRGIVEKLLGDGSGRDEP